MGADHINRALRAVLDRAFGEQEGPVSTRASTAKVSYNWHLRMRMAERGMFATSDLVPLLAERGVVLSREQVYRLVAKVPERVSLTVLAALCDALGVSPAELVEPVRAERKAAPAKARVGPGSGARHPAPPGPGGPDGVSPARQQAWRDLVARRVAEAGPGLQRRPGQLGHRRCRHRTPRRCRCWPERSSQARAPWLVGAPPVVGKLVAELRARGSALPEPTCARCGRAHPKLTAS